mgnify:CR=1 FL=1
MQLPSDAKFWSRKYRRRRITEMAAQYLVEQVAVVFGCSMEYVEQVCVELGVSCQRAVPKPPKVERPRVEKPKKSKVEKPQIEEPAPIDITPERFDLTEANVHIWGKYVERRWAQNCCLACGEEFCGWQKRADAQTVISFYSFCAECAGELFFDKIRLPEELSSNWLTHVPGWSYRNRRGCYPLDDVSPWYENARRAYEGD